MQTASVKLYTFSYRELRTYVAVALFVAGNIVLPQLCHLIPQGGLIWLPIYFFTLIAAYKLASGHADSRAVADSQLSALRNAGG